MRIVRIAASRSFFIKHNLVCLPSIFLGTNKNWVVVLIHHKHQCKKNHQISLPLKAKLPLSKSQPHKTDYLLVLTLLNTAITIMQINHEGFFFIRSLTYTCNSCGGRHAASMCNSIKHVQIWPINWHTGKASVNFHKLSTYLHNYKGKKMLFLDGFKLGFNIQ